ncbi:MAG: hypothetical protein NC123_17770 [Butyrivibrio sp.]|nr:hypothetical protein [Acetatifactor muris]MCM1561362.1 hypothetical protein [Butyrivibrio sp.]
MEKLINEISDKYAVSEDLLQRLRKLVSSNYLMQSDNPQNTAFRCGCSKAGRAFQEVLGILNELSVSYELLFAEKDFDLKMRYNDRDYLCEIVLNDSAERPVRNIRMNAEQRECWLAENGEHGILYYYLKTGRLEFYSIGEENELLACFRTETL